MSFLFLCSFILTLVEGQAQRMSRLVQPVDANCDYGIYKQNWIDLGFRFNSWKLAKNKSLTSGICFVDTFELWFYNEQQPEKISTPEVYVNKRCQISVDVFIFHLVL